MWARWLGRLSSNACWVTVFKRKIRSFWGSQGRECWTLTESRPRKHLFLRRVYGNLGRARSNRRTLWGWHPWILRGDKGCSELALGKKSVRIIILLFLVMDKSRSDGCAWLRLIPSSLQIATRLADEKWNASSSEGLHESSRPRFWDRNARCGYKGSSHMELLPQQLSINWKTLLRHVSWYQSSIIIASGLDKGLDECVGFLIRFHSRCNSRWRFGWWCVVGLGEFCTAWGWVESN